MIMVADAIRLALFPAMMAFAASSDFLTLTISNRGSLILVGGFVALAGMGGGRAAGGFSRVAPPRTRCGVYLVCPRHRRRGRRQPRGRHGTLARLRSSFALSALRITA